MDWLLSGSVLLLATLGMKPEDRGIYREAAEWYVVDGEPSEAVHTPSIRTDFECADLGSHEELCWLKGGVRICVRDVEIIDSEINSFGERSLAGADPARCFSEAEPQLMLTFDPPPTSIELTLALDRDSARDRVRIACWSAGSSHIGDEAWAYVLEPDDAMAPGDTHGWGIGSGAGLAACRVYGVADNIGTY